MRKQIDISFGAPGNRDKLKRPEMGKYDENILILW